MSGQPAIGRRALLAATCALPFASAGRAAAATPLRVGQCLPFTGPLAAVVKPIAEGQQLLLAAVAAEGGVQGTPIELITLDDGGQPARTEALTRALLDEKKVAALFGYASVPGLVRTLPLLDERQVPLIGVYNGADILRDASHPWLFTTTASLHDEVTAMVRNLATLNSRKLAVAYQNNELGRFMLPLVEAIAGQHQVQIVAKAAVEPDGANAKEAAAAVVSLAPQAILLLAAGAAVIGFMTALPKPRMPVYALSLAGTTSLVERLGPVAHGMAFTQVIPSPQRVTTPLARRFTLAAAAAGLAPTYDRMWGFLNAAILVEVLRRAGPRATPVAVQAALERMGEVDLGGYRVAFDKRRRHGSSFVEITMVDAGGRFIR
jgi:branched-chain amino acid transport system substrate-binding protein